MTHRAVLPAALILAFVACERQPSAPRPPGYEPSFARSEETGPPPAQDFGPDSRETGEPYTGQGVESEGLNCPDQTSGRRQCNGYLASQVDGTMLDVRVDLPDAAPPYPLVVLMHGWAGSKSGSGDIADKLLADGYAVLRYSARGFGDSWGKVNLSDIGVEVGAPSDPSTCTVAPPGDLQSMIGKVVDDPRLTLNADAVAVTGASYGGGQSWLATLQPRFLSPAGACVRLRTIVPIVPWTDLLYSLMPNGRPRHSIEPLGGLKFSYVNALYFSGFREPTQKRPFDNYPTYLKAWHTTLNGVEPMRENAALFQPIVDGVAGYRSIWWQQSFWQAVVSAPEPIPVFQVQGFTDDLFSFEEAKRMLLALQTVRPSYPIASYFGDIGHPRARNQQAEVDYALELIRDWLAYYLKGIGAAPQHIVHAAITQPSGGTFNPSNVITVPTYADLATDEIRHKFKTPALLVNPGGAPSGPLRDPVLEAGIKQGGELQPLPGQTPVPAVPDPTAATYEVSLQSLSPGAALLIAGQPTVSLKARTTGVRVQLNVRLLDVAPNGTMELITRGTYTVESPVIGAPLGRIDVTIPTTGNLWRVEPGHAIRLEIVNADVPYMRPSIVPSSTQISDVTLWLPIRN